MTPIHILVVDDDLLLRKTLVDLLSRWGHQVTAGACLADAREALEKNTFDLVMLDMRLPDGNGLEFLDEQKKACPDINVVMITAYADVRTAVASIKCGAFDYLAKPFEEEELQKIVRNVSAKTDLTQRVTALSQLTSKSFGDIIVKTEAIRKIYEKAKKIAASPDTTVLVLGESGTGKGLLAKSLHRMSPRAARPFIDINCSAIPEQLMESELFGYERGAFTDAKSRKIGLLEAANGGTVFLDEIGDMSVNLQGKLLKVIEEKEFRRLGSAVPTRVDIRILAATSRNLMERIKEGAFREDLYYRLSVVPVVLPPLRDRLDCVMPLAEHYLQYYSKKIGRPVTQLDKESIHILKEYAWPGNIRELCNVIERAVILTSHDKIMPEDLGITLKAKTSAAAPQATEADETPKATAPSPMPTDDRIAPMTLAESEKRLIKSILIQVNGNRSKAAEILDIHRTTLYKKIEEYKLA